MLRLHLLLVTYILAVSAVTGEFKVIVPDEELPAESARLLSRDEINDGFYYGQRTRNQNGDMQTARRYYSQKYNQEDHNSGYQGVNKDGHDYRIKLQDFENLQRRENYMHDNNRGVVRQSDFKTDVYASDYHQPTWVLDYRYLKTGGRDYIRNLNTEIPIILKNSNRDKYKNYPNYDSVLEHLRLKNIAERNKLRRH